MTFVEAIQAIENDWRLLKDLHWEFRINPSVVSRAIQINPYAFEFASDSLKNNFFFFGFAIRESSECWQYGSLELITRILQSRDLVKECLSMNGLILTFLPEHYQNDFELATIAYEESDHLEVIPSGLLHNRDFVKQLIEVSSRDFTLSDLPVAIQKEEEIQDAYSRSGRQ